MRLFVWAQLGLNQRPPDYESGATNQLSYGPKNKVFADFNILGLQVYNFVTKYTNNFIEITAIIKYFARKFENY